MTDAHHHHHVTDVMIHTSANLLNCVYLMHAGTVVGNKKFIITTIKMFLHLVHYLQYRESFGCYQLPS